MDHNPLYPTAAAGFVLLTIGYLALFIREIKRGVTLTGWRNEEKKAFLTRIIVALVVWACFVSGWSFYGAMPDFGLFPFNVMPVVVVPMIVAAFFLSSKKTGDVLRHIPPANIIRLQSFRFVVEILLWILFVADALPVQMTFEGRNFDILAGFSAPIIAVLLAKGNISKSGVVIWNIIGLALLLNIVITAILSMPSPWRVFMNEPANYVVTYFPFSWLPGFLVPLAYYLHFMSLRQMKQRQPDISVH